MKAPSPRLNASLLFSRRLTATLCAVAVSGSNLLFAANGTWDGGSLTDGNWTTLGNWSGDAAFPGATSGATNADIAIFNTAIANTWGASGTPIIIDSATLNIKGITFDAAAGNYVIGTTAGNALYLTNGGTIQMTNALANGSTQTINAPLVIVGENGTYTFNNAKNENTSSLRLGGTITGGSAGNTVINFTSANGGAPNAVNGTISNGVATSLALNHNSGTWSYNGNNTYTGNTTIVAGSARFTGNNSGGGNFTVNAGGAAYFTGTNTYTGTFTFTGNTVSSANLFLGSDTVATGSLLNVTRIDATTARLYINNVAGNADRLNDGLALSLGGINSIFQLQGNATTNTVETIGAITFKAGYSTIDLTNPTGRITTLNAASLTRDTGFGTALINSRTLGIGATQTGRIFLSTAPSGINLVGTGGSPGALSTGVKNLAIVPWLYGTDNSVGRFITYDTVTGLRYLAANETQASITAATAAAPGATGDNVLQTATETGITSKTINSLMLTPTADQAITGAGAGNTLTISSGAFALTNARTATLSGFDTITFGNSEGVITTGHASAVIRFDSAINVTNGGGITKTGAGLLILNAANTYAGPTTINQGTLQIGTGGTTGDLGASSLINLRIGATLAFNRTDALEIGSVGGGGTITMSQAGTLTLNQTGTGNVIASIGGVSGSTVIFAGDGETTINAKPAVQGQLLKFESGTINLANGRQTVSNLEIAGGVVNTLDGQFSMRLTSAGTQTLTISSGALNITGQYGIKGLNSENSDTGIVSDFIGTQTGGTFSIGGTGSDGFQLGNGTAGSDTTYSLSGGLLKYLGAGSNGFNLTANTAGTNTTTFNFSGGTLLSRQTIVGISGNGAKQAFVWTGGVLATVGYDATKLTSTAGTQVSASTNTLTNAGGILAPGDIGTTGRTIITGNYAVASADAGLHIDIAGTTVSSAFQDAATTGRYDQVSMNGAGRVVTLGGKLYVNLLDGYNGSGSFVILTNIGAGGSITGTFSNTVADSLGEGVRVVLDNGIGSFLVDYNTTNVTLGTYVANNAWAGYDGADWSEVSNWTAFTPQAAGHIAQFTSAVGGGVINLDTGRTIGGILFDNADDSYALSGAGTLTLDNTRVTGPSDSTITVANGTHTVAVPVVLNNNLVIATTGATSGLTISGGIGGTGKALAKTGTGSLTLTAANTYTGGTTVSAGSLFVNNISGSGIGTGSLSIAAGALLGGSGRIGGATVIHGQLAPGATVDSTSVLTFDNAVTFKIGSSLAIDIAGAAARGTDYDGVNFNGALTIEGGTLTFNISAAIADNSVLTIFTGTDLSAGFTSVTATGTGPGSAYNGAFTFNAGPSTYTGIFGDQTLTLDLAGGTLSFTGSAIPEPSVCAALIGAAALAFVACRRRRT